MLGRQDGGWQQSAAADIPGGLATGEWYHLAVSVAGCRITVTGSPARPGARPAALTYRDPDCSFAHGAIGAIGVRGQAGTASWRDITVTAGGRPV